MTRSTSKSAGQYEAPADGSQLEEFARLRLLQIGDRCYVVNKGGYLGAPSIEAGILTAFPSLGGAPAKVNTGWLLDQNVDPLRVHASEADARAQFAAFLKLYRAKLKRDLAKMMAIDPKTVPIRDKTAQAPRRVKALAKGGAR